MLKLRNISKTFVDGLSILKGIDLQLKQGDFCVVIGANGSGKSTLLKIISGEYKSDRGSTFIDGRKYSQRDRSNFIAQVIQDVNKGTIPEMTLLENMALSQMRVGRTRVAFYNRHKDSVIKKIKDVGVGLESYVNKPLSSLSGGQRQMVATIMAVSSYPKLLLLDEHTSALDPKMGKTLMDYTAKAIENHKLTSIMVTHKLDDAIKYGNRLIMLHHGKIVFDVSGAAKSRLKIDELLELFHKYEDLSLTSEVIT